MSYQNSVEEFQQRRRTFSEGMTDGARENAEQCDACESHVRPVVNQTNEPACPVCGSHFLTQSNR